MNDQITSAHEEMFAGFPIPTKNFFHMPNNFTDTCADIDNVAELKVVLYVMRHTWGYQEYGIYKVITTDEFMYGRKREDGTRMDKGAGIKSNKSVVEGLKRAVEHGYLLCDEDDTDKARIKKAYMPRMADSASGCVESTHPDSYVTSTHQTCNPYIADMQHLHSNYVADTHRSEKETLERNSRKTQKKEKAIVDVASAHAEHDAPSPFSLADEDLIALLSARGYQVMPSQQITPEEPEQPASSELPDTNESPFQQQPDGVSYSPNSSDEKQDTPPKGKGRGGKRASRTAKEQPALFENEQAQTQEAIYDERRRFWQKHINAWRMKPLPSKGLCINESDNLLKLVAEYTDAQINEIVREMMTKWPYQKDPRSIGGRAMYAESGPVSGTLKDRNAWPDESVKLEKVVEVKAPVIPFPTRQIQNTPAPQLRRYDPSKDDGARIVNRTATPMKTLSPKAVLKQAIAAQQAEKSANNTENVTAERKIAQ
jgi:hypothetical protein